MNLISNSFSLGMLSSRENVLATEEISSAEAKILFSGWKTGEWSSAVGHDSTADLFSNLLGFPIPANRINVSLTTGDTLIVGQLMQRLPEGTILSPQEIAQLPIKWVVVTIK